MESHTANPYSTIGTRTRIDKKTNTIEKEIIHRCCSTLEALECYEEYISSLSDCDQFLATYCFCDKDKIKLCQQIYGVKFYEHEKEMEFNKLFKILPQIISLFDYSISHKIYIDPHLSNFHIDDNKLKLVDCSPPYSKKYNYYVNRKCKTSHERFFLMRNCRFFRWDMLPFHFMGDLTEIAPQSTKYFSYLYQEFKVIMPKNIFMSEFIERSMMIRHHENLRIKHQYNLL